MKPKGTCVVLGLGASGRSAARLLAREGHAVLALDEADGALLRQATASLADDGVTVALGARALPSGPLELAVLSPGIAPEHPWVVALERRGVPVLPEFELGWTRLRGETLAVTGTNGKSTAVKWLAESLRHAGLSAEACGNYGLPVCEVALAPTSPQWAVIEVSSFQLEMARDFRARVGVLLNLLPNHLDRHPDFASYAAAKAKLFARTLPGDSQIVPIADVHRLQERAGATGVGKWITFGPGGDYRFSDGAVLRDERPIADLRGTYFDNEILGVNASAVVAALDAAGLFAVHAVEAARTFEPLPHRMQPVGTVRGVSYIDDSKATTLSAVDAALRMCRGAVRLIAGGLLKETPAPALKEVLAQRTSCIYLIGRASKELYSAWADAVPCVECGTLEEAFKAAARDARGGEVVLLSPGCASFDQFTGYHQRGEVFRSLVKALK